MKTFDYVITDEVGIHARPAGTLVKEAKNYKSKATISANGRSADLTRLMSIMSLGVKKGTQVTILVEGEDEEEAAEKLETFFKENL